jgi:hypothetical protein
VEEVDLGIEGLQQFSLLVQEGLVAVEEVLVVMVVLGRPILVEGVEDQIERKQVLVVQEVLVL